MNPKTTIFNVQRTPIGGLLEISVTSVEDQRGWFQEKYQREKLVSQGFPDDFMPVQQNVSLSKEVGVIRGIHSQPWNKYVSVISGKVFAVFVDLRKGHGFGNKFELEIDSQKAIFVPKNVGNSFQTLLPDTIYSYLVDKHWSADNINQYVSINVADPILKIHWPISLDKAIISEKDLAAPFLLDVDPI